VKLPRIPPIPLQVHPLVLCSFVLLALLSVEPALLLLLFCFLDSLCSACKKTKSQKTVPSPSTSCVETCPGGTYYRPKPDNSQPSSPPQTRQEPPKLTGRNLKRVPSEKFQKTRRKLQRLMQHADDEERVPGSPVDDATFLKSIRIPNPAQVRPDPERYIHTSYAT